MLVKRDDSLRNRESTPWIQGLIKQRRKRREWFELRRNEWYPVLHRDLLSFSAADDVSLERVPVFLSPFGMYRRAYHDIFFLNGAPKPSNRRSFRTRTVYRESLGINWSCVWTTPIRYPTNDRWWVGEPTRKVRSTCLTEINRSWWYLERFVFYAPRLHLSSRSRWDERIGRECSICYMSKVIRTPYELWGGY